jgi:hypothetical protein
MWYEGKEAGAPVEPLSFIEIVYWNSYVARKENMATSTFLHRFRSSFGSYALSEPLLKPLTGRIIEGVPLDSTR